MKILISVPNGPYAMSGYEVTADSEQPMKFRVCLSAVKINQWMPPKYSHVGVFDVTCIRIIAGQRSSEAVLLCFKWKSTPHPALTLETFLRSHSDCIMDVKLDIFGNQDGLSSSSTEGFQDSE
ncbi:unnamed protein product [Larinioides sclopetarius]|uniref:Uncharacterized protein n=1 Tax=Larinioides sclopetarius TaxID=280406 RepID=A0AAV1YQM0_9ARAC